MQRFILVTYFYSIIVQ